MVLGLAALHGTALLAHYRITPASSRLMSLDMANQTNHPPLTIGRFATWFRDFLDALALQKVSFVGSSQGGAIALQFTLEYPERVDRLVLVDSVGLGKGLSLAIIRNQIFELPRKASVPGGYRE
jgi:pimeloyl-ACP methyl ester carboxylesterase